MEPNLPLFLLYKMNQKNTFDSIVTHILQAIPGVLKIKEKYNPAAWMLEVSSASAEVQLGINFADYFIKSPQYQ